MDNQVCDEQRIIGRHNQLQRSENENPLLPIATLMAGFTGVIRVISDWIRYLALTLLIYALTARDNLEQYMILY